MQLDLSQKINEQLKTKNYPVVLNKDSGTLNPKILQISRIESPISKYKKTESIEQVIMQLVDSLKKQNINVNVAAPGDSEPYDDYNIIPTITKSFGEKYGGNFDDLKKNIKSQHYNSALNHAIQGNFDIIHDHYHLIKLPEFGDFLNKYVNSPPILSTLHVPLKRENDIDKIKEADLLGAYFSVVSEDQRKIFINQLGIDENKIFSVHNGIEPNDFPLNVDKQNYLLFLGRINKDKGVESACKLAKDTGNTLVISGYVDTREANQRYFKESVEPYIDISLQLQGNKEVYNRALTELVTNNPGKIIYVGRSDRDQRVILYQNSKAFLFTSGMENDWQEPFGLVSIEANSTGTPVIANRNGAIQEIIKEGTNGYSADTYDGLVNIINQNLNFDPNEVRKHVLVNFTSDYIGKKYLELYKEICQRHKRDKSSLSLKKVFYS